jgi:hypothetical protein
MMRVVNKSLCDYTGIMQVRGPGEMGGIYWSTNTFAALVVPFVVVSVFFKNLEDGASGGEEQQEGTPEEGALEEGTPEEGALEEGATSEFFTEALAWRLVVTMSFGWLVLFGVFFKSMKEEFRQTFWSSETGNEWVQDCFLNGDSDDVKMQIMHFNKAKWMPIEDQGRGGGVGGGVRATRAHRRRRKSPARSCR